MLRLSKTTAVLFLLLLLPSPARAQTPSEDIEVTPGFPQGDIDIEVSDEDRSEGADSGQSGADSNDGGGAASRVRCTYTFAYRGNANVAPLDPTADQSGDDGDLNIGDQFDWYTKECTDGTWDQIAVPVGDGPPGGAEDVDPIVLAFRAQANLTLPRPKAHRYPAASLTDGRPYTLVNAPTWYWTDAATFKVVASPRVEAGQAWARVTATPMALDFDPGDGSPSVSCKGPGSAAPKNASLWAAAPSGCDYRYQESTFGRPGGVLTATYSIRWRVTWVGSGGASGSLPVMTTSTQSTFAVAEAQSVVAP